VVLDIHNRPNGDVAREKRVAWSDSLFGAPIDQAKAKLLAELCAAVYSGTVAAAAGPEAANVHQLTATPLIPSWALELDGETIVVIAGTTSAAQYADQANGWAHPSGWVTGGEINAYHAVQADLLFAALPAAATMFVGHSLGGALAELLAWRIQQTVGSTTRVVSFGAPRPLTLQAAASASWPASLHFWFQFDPVPRTVPDGTAGREWRLPGNAYQLFGNGFIEPFAVPALGIVPYAAFVGEHGFSWHNIDAYVDAFVVPSSSPFLIGGASMAAEFYLCSIKGLLFGQAADFLL